MPVLAVDLTGGTDPIPYASLAVPVVSDLARLEPTLRAFIGDAAVRAAQAPVSAALARTNERSAEKIAALIERIGQR